MVAFEFLFSLYRASGVADFHNDFGQFRGAMFLKINLLGNMLLPANGVKGLTGKNELNILRKKNISGNDSGPHHSLPSDVSVPSIFSLSAIIYILSLKIEFVTVDEIPI